MTPGEIDWPLWTAAKNPLRSSTSLFKMLKSFLKISRHSRSTSAWSISHNTHSSVVCKMRKSTVFVSRCFGCNLRLVNIYSSRVKKAIASSSYKRAMWLWKLMGLKYLSYPKGRLLVSLLCCLEPLEQLQSNAVFRVIGSSWWSRLFIKLSCNSWKLWSTQGIKRLLKKLDLSNIWPTNKSLLFPTR